MENDVAASRYPGQPEDEVTQRVFYKSFVAIAPMVLAGVLLAFVCVFGLSYGVLHPEVSIDKYLPTVSGSVIGLASFLGIVLDGLFLAAVMWIWRNNRILVTNEHIVDIDQTTLFHRTVSTLTLSRIQDVRAAVDGPLQTLFQYGTIVVQTAGEKENFAFDYVPNPYEAEQYVIKVHKDYEAAHADKPDGTREEKIEE